MTASRDPSRCTHSSHRCHHAAHAYTGVPCSVSSKRQRSKSRKPARRQAMGSMLPNIGNSGAGRKGPDQPVTLQLKQGGNVQALRLPTEKLEPNKKYYDPRVWIRYFCA